MKSKNKKKVKKTSNIRHVIYCEIVKGCNTCPSVYIDSYYKTKDLCTVLNKKNGKFVSEHRIPKWCPFIVRKKGKNKMSKQTGIVVKLTGEDGNAFAILGKVKREMKRNGVDPQIINDFMNEAMSGDYNHLLQTCMEYVEVE